MANALDMLGSLIQAGMTKSSADRVKNALGEGGQGGLGGILDQFAKQVGGAEAGGGFLDSLSKMAQGALKDPKETAQAGWDDQADEQVFWRAEPAQRGFLSTDGPSAVRRRYQHAGPAARGVRAQFPRPCSHSEHRRGGGPRS